MKSSPRIKICGLTDVDEAVECARLGADAIGFIFFEKSPRNLTVKKATQIRAALPDTVAVIGVFVDEPFEHILSVTKQAGLTGVQLHGNETPETVNRLMAKNLTVIKGLFEKKPPAFEESNRFHPSAFLLECGKGKLPGGNAMKWDWKKATDFAGRHPFVLAGGLEPDNVARAISVAFPDGVDVSSGVESKPGRKDLSKVAAFIENVKNNPFERKILPVFHSVKGNKP